MTIIEAQAVIALAEKEGADAVSQEKLLSAVNVVNPDDLEANATAVGMLYPPKEGFPVL